MEDRKNKAVKVYIIYICIMLLVSGYARLNGIIFRQYLRYVNEVIVIIGLVYLLIRLKRLIPKEKKFIRLAVSLLAVIIAVVAVMGICVFETDRETVVTVEGEKKIRVESSFFMYYEVTYYDYGNIFSYRAYPSIEENYDDGDPGQWIYTDYYDENGTLVERVFKEEND